MADRPWKAEERRVAKLLGGARYPANSGGRVDVASSQVVCQVKHVRRLPLVVLERLSVELEALGKAQGKVGLVVVKRRAGRGKPTPRLLVMTETAFEAWRANLAGPKPNTEDVIE